MASPDLLQIFMAAQQAKNERLKGELLQTQLEQQNMVSDQARLDQYRAQDLAEARQRFGMGLTQQLDQLAPMEAQQVRQQAAQAQMAQQEQKNKAATNAAELDQRSATLMIKAVDYLANQQDPASVAGHLMSDMERLAKEGVIRPEAPGMLRETIFGGPDVRSNVRALRARIEPLYAAVKKPAEVTGQMVNAEAIAGRNIDPQRGGMSDPGRGYLAQMTLPQEKPQPTAGERSLSAAEPLRKDFQSQQVVKNTALLAEAYSKISRTSETGAGDMSLIFGYMKMLDPGSTVREGEYATAQNAGSVPQGVVAAYNRAISGEKLAPELRNQFKNEAKSIYSSQLERYNAAANQYRKLAAESGARPDQVVLDYGFEKLLEPQKKYPEGFTPDGAR